MWLESIFCSSVTQGKIEYGVSLWKLQDMIDPQTVTTSLSMLPTMEKAGSVPHKASSSVLKVTWNPSVEQLATYDDQKLIIWQIAEGQPKVNNRMWSMDHKVECKCLVDKCVQG